MRPVSLWLERFRRPAGVPAAVSEELESELLPVFAVLDEIDAEAVRLREDAEREAERRREAALAEAERRLAEWRRRAEAERARAEARRRAEIETEVHAIEADGAAEAARLRALGEERMPALVDRILACLTEVES